MNATMTTMGNDIKAVVQTQDQMLDILLGSRDPSVAPTGSAAASAPVASADTSAPTTSTASGGPGRRINRRT